MQKLATVTVFLVVLLAQFVLLPVSAYADQWWPTFPTGLPEVVVGVSDVQPVVLLSDIECLITNGPTSQSLCTGFRNVSSRMRHD